jgi:hypothetical protein
LERLQDRRDASLSFRVLGGEGVEHTDASNPLALLSINAKGSNQHQVVQHRVTADMAADKFESTGSAAQKPTNPKVAPSSISGIERQMAMAMISRSLRGTDRIRLPPRTAVISPTSLSARRRLAGGIGNWPEGAWSMLSVSCIDKMAASIELC